jgi:hypothetical protein
MPHRPCVKSAAGQYPKRHAIVHLSLGGADASARKRYAVTSLDGRRLDSVGFATETPMRRRFQTVNSRPMASQICLDRSRSVRGSGI